MSAPYRVRRSDIGVVPVSRRGGEEFKWYLDRLMKMIPAEVVGLYLIGTGLIPDQQKLADVVWFLVCLVAVLVIRTYGTSDRVKREPPQPIPIGVAMVAFVIWVYTIGGPFKAFGLSVPYVGSLLVLAWSFFVPFIYKGD
jgi:hypothetical protein